MTNIDYNNLSQMAREYDCSIHTLINMESTYGLLYCVSVQISKDIAIFWTWAPIVFLSDYSEIQLIKWRLVTLIGCINPGTIKSHWRTRWNWGRVNPPTPHLNKGWIKAKINFFKYLDHQSCKTSRSKGGNDMKGRKI